MSPVELTAADTLGLPLLSLVLIVPIAFAVLALFAQDGVQVRRVALIGAALELILASLPLFLIDRDHPGMQLVERHEWMPSLGVMAQLGVDGLSAPLLALTALITLGVIAVGAGPQQRMPQVWVGAIFTLETALMGVYTAQDLIFFFMFWEMTLIPLHLLTSIYGVGRERGFAANKLVMTMMVGGGVLLLAFLLLGETHRELTGLGLSFDPVKLQALDIPLSRQLLLFGLMLIGFGFKAPIFPFHSWMPGLLQEGSLGVGVMTVGFKLGVYGLIRFVLPLTPDAVVLAAPLLAVLGVSGLFYGALVALRQESLRRALAFGGLSHVGFALVGLASLNVQGVQGAVICLVNMALLSTGVFLLTGFVWLRTRTSELHQLGGLWLTMPKMSTFFVLLSVAGLGLPGTSGFIGEHLVLLGAARANPAWALLLALGAALGAAWTWRLFQSVIFGRPQGDAATATDLRPRELLCVALLAALTLGGGLVPGPLLALTRAPVEAITARLDEAQQRAEARQGEWLVSIGVINHDLPTQN